MNNPPVTQETKRRILLIKSIKGLKRFIAINRRFICNVAADESSYPHPDNNVLTTLANVEESLARAETTIESTLDKPLCGPCELHTK
jgi:hypothetical protein